MRSSNRIIQLLPDHAEHILRHAENLVFLCLSDDKRYVGRISGLNILVVECGAVVDIGFEARIARHRLSAQKG